MIIDRKILYLTSADFIVRAAYQMGKTPLLPLFALSLGASKQYLGLIVSVSTLTGTVLKPWIGLLSDAIGRKIWLLIGTAVFALMPFVYRWIDTPQQLMMVRILHGLATAIYGPVTLAYVVDHSPGQCAERLGWFGMARTAGYIVGPALAGWLLLSLTPVGVFTCIGILSSAAFLPVLLLDSQAITPTAAPAERRRGGLYGFREAAAHPAIWLAGGLEAGMYLSIYALKAFLPVFAVSAGINIALVGLFFSVQEASHLLLKPWGGKWGDRHGYLAAIGLGLMVLAGTISSLTIIQHPYGLMFLAVLIGCSEALIVPSSLALASHQLHGIHVGTGMGLVGMCKNAGKVAGPLFAGAWLQGSSFPSLLRILGLITLGSALVVLAASRRQRAGAGGG